MKVKFGDVIPGQVFQWNAQTMVKVHPWGAANVWDGESRGLIPDDVEVEVNDDQLKQTPSLMDEVVELPKSVYDAMCDEADWLSALETAGVDNWEGYDMAREIYNEGKNGEA